MGSPDDARGAAFGVVAGWLAGRSDPPDRCEAWTVRSLPCQSRRRSCRAWESEKGWGWSMALLITTDREFGCCSTLQGARSGGTTQSTYILAKVGVCVRLLSIGGHLS